MSGGRRKPVGRSLQASASLGPARHEANRSNHQRPGDTSTSNQPRQTQPAFLVHKEGSQHGSHTEPPPPQTPSEAPQPALSQDAQQLQDSAESPHPVQQPKAQQAQQRSAASASSRQPQQISTASNSSQQPQQVGAASSSSQQAQQSSAAPKCTQQPQQNSDASSSSHQTQPENQAGRAAGTGQQRGWQEPWQACYFTHQHKVNLGLQFSKPLPRPRDQRGRPASMHPSWNLHFTTWEVQKAFIDARQDGHAGRYAEAREKMLEVHRMEPWNNRILTDVAELCFALGSVDEADLWAGFAIAMNSGNSLAHQRRARARQAYGFLAGAESDWQNAILAACDGYNTAKIEEELRKVRELAASAPQAEQEAARQRSHQSDAEIASRVRHARAARAHYVAKERAITALRQEMAATYKHMREVGQAKELKARLQETYREQNEQLAALIKHGRGSGKHEFETCMHIPVDAATGSSDSSVAEGSKGKGKKQAGRSWTGLKVDGLNELDNREGKELRNCMEADMAQEEQHSQAASQALAAFQAGRSSSSSVSGMHQGSDSQLESEDAANTLLSMSPQFVHNLQPEEVDILLASGCKVRVCSRADLERVCSERGLQEVDLEQFETEPGREQLCGQSGSHQEADSQKGSSQNADARKLAGNNKKKKKNRKKGPTAAQVEQVTARGIMEGPPAPEGPPTPEEPLPCPSKEEPSSDNQAADASAASIDLAEQRCRIQPEADVFVEGEPDKAPQSPEEPELARDVRTIEPEMFSGPGFSPTDAEHLDRLRISVPTESEEELFHDAGSGFESAVQLTSLGSRRASTDSDMAWPLYSSTGTDSGPKTPEGNLEQQYQEAQEALLTPPGAISGLDIQDEEPEQCFQEAQEAPSAYSGEVVNAEDTPAQAAAPEQDGSELQAVGSPELQGKVRAAREAMGRQDYKAALELCKQAERLDRTCLAPPGLLVKAQAHLSLRNYRMCIGLYGLIASQCGGLPHQDRVDYFNQAALAAEDLLSDANPKAVHSAHKLLASLDKLQCCPEHAAKMVYLESYTRLRQRGVFTHLQHFEFIPQDMDPQDAEHVLVEAEALLKKDAAVLDAMAAISEPSVTAYRKIMAKAAKEKGNLCSKDREYGRALERYTLALTLDADNISALSNRAQTHLMVNDPERAIVDATAVIEAVEGGAVQDSKQQKDLRSKALYRRGQAYYELGCRTRHAPHYLRAWEDFNAMNSNRQEVTNLMSLCHGLVLQNGGVQELAALGGAFPSKTRPAPPSEEDLAEMGEDGSGLSMEDMLHNISRPRPSPSTDPLGNDAPGSSDQPSEGASITEVSKPAAKAHTEAEQPQLQQQQQESQTEPSPSNTADASSSPKLSHGTGKQRAKSFGFSFPQPKNAAKDKQAVQRNAASKGIHCPGPKDFVLKFPGPEVASQAAAALGASTSAEAASSSAASNADPMEADKAEKAQPDRARKPIKLPAYETSLVRNVEMGVNLAKGSAVGSHLLRYLTGEERGVYGGCLGEGFRLDPEKLGEAIHSQCGKVVLRAEQLYQAGRCQDAAKLLDSLARTTGAPAVHMAAASHYMIPEMVTDSIACAEAVLAEHPGNLEALMHVAQIYATQGYHAKLAEACTRILRFHGHRDDVREARALANYKAGHTLSYEQDVEELRKVPGWRPTMPELAAIIRQPGRQKGKRRSGARR